MSLETAEKIEKLSRQLEQQIIYYDLKECETIEDFQRLKEKYEAICEAQG